MAHIENVQHSHKGDGDTPIRRMTSADIPDGMCLKTLAGWNQTERDWQLILDNSPHGCYVAEYEGTVIGTVTTITYEHGLSWIGMMLVDPSYRRRGIGSRLMSHAVDALRGHGSTKLDATPAGNQVYDRLGFTVEYEILRMTSEQTHITGATSDTVSPLSVDDLAAISDMDTHAFGDGRSALLSSFAINCPGIARKLVRNDMITGFCLGRTGTQFTQIGPVVAETPDDAAGVVRSALESLAGNAVVLDVPAAQTDFLHGLKSCGFIEQRRLIRMFYDENSHPGAPDRIYAIGGPELG